MDMATVDHDVVAELGNLLTVWAHPDDESYLTGGLMAAAVAGGQRTVCVTATHATGLRSREMAAALEVLGVSEHLQLDHLDGACHTADAAAAAKKVADVIRVVRPDTVVTFGADGHTGHLDHKAVSSWVTAALATHGDGVRLLHPAMTHEQVAEFADMHAEFSIFTDGTPHPVSSSDLAYSLTLEGSALEQKVAALEAHTSQTRPLIDAIGRERFSAWVATENFVLA